MPAQRTSPKIEVYQEFDTAPPLQKILKDGNGEPIDLTGCTVTIDVAHASYDYYYSPMWRIVEDGPVDIGAPETDGLVQWFPQEGDLYPAGSYQYRFKITYGDGTVQHIPARTYLPLTITSRPGGSEVPV